MRTLTFTLAISALTLAMGAGTAQAEPMVISDGTNASGILGLEVKGTLYDVAFRFLDANILYGTDPNFDFNETDALIARNVINDALNTEGGIETVGFEGIPAGQDIIFNIGVAGFETTITTVQGKYFVSSGWEDDGVGVTTHTKNEVYADFSPAVVPEPGTALLLGLAGLGMVARRRGQKSEATA